MTDPSVFFRCHYEILGNGLCSVWRRLALALVASGVPVRLDSWGEHGVPSQAVLDEIGSLLSADVNPSVMLAAAGFTPQVTGRLRVAQQEADRRAGGKLGFVCMIERDRVAPETVVAGAGIKQWWLPCDSNIEAFARSGFARDRLKKVLVAMPDQYELLKMPGRGRMSGPVRFYHVGTMCPRKEQMKMLTAFLRAFRPGGPTLTIKTTHFEPGVPGSFEQMVALCLADEAVLGNGWTEANIPESVRFICAIWTAGQMAELHATSDVYVSLSHGEGWDMPAFDAVLVGNRLVYTPSGGPQEFAGPEEYVVPVSRMIPCAAILRWERAARWCDFDLFPAVEALRAAADGSLEKKQRADFSRFTQQSVGRRARGLIEEMGAT